MPPASVLDRYARFGFAQAADDLLFGKTLLHVQSAGGRELDSKLRCYPKLGAAIFCDTQLTTGNRYLNGIF